MGTPILDIARSLKNLGPFRSIVGQDDEVALYYWRACLAAKEERWDVGLIFCSKALAIDPSHLPTRLLRAQIQDHGLNDLAAAVAAYRKVIALAGYDGQNPYCLAARASLDRIVSMFVAAKSVAESAEPSV